MAEYLVELRGEIREVYSVEASSPEEAESEWSTRGSLYVSEASSMEIYDVREERE